jgi:nucleotide-binding universal stress UspA family protein
MLQPTLVLAPVDFSDPSHEAVETAADIASRFKAALFLVHVVPALPRLPAGVSIFKESEYEKSLHEDAVRRIGELAAQHSSAAISVRSEVGISNDVGMEILRIGERNKADLIVIATHGMTGWNALGFGSVAEKIVRMAQSAVLVLRASPEKKR